MKAFTFTLLLFITLINSGYAQLQSTQIGSSGNLYSVLYNESNQVYASQNLNTIIFIHRNNDDIFGGYHSQYRYDISTDGGTSWTSDVGVINPSANADTLNSRYPQALIYDPSNSNIVDSSYLIYNGPYHDGTGLIGAWNGICTGVAQLGGDTLTYTESYQYMNAGDVLIPTGLCKGAPGIFWSVDWDYDGSSKMEILLYKGIWVDSLKDVVWEIQNKFDPGHKPDNNGNAIGASLNMSFDPTGEYGWIVFGGDISGSGVLDPIFYKTIDSGLTWIGPIELDLNNFSIVDNGLDSMGSGEPMVAFEADIIVDKNGDPHFVNVVGAGQDFSMQWAWALDIYDFTYSNSESTWKAIHLDTIYTFRAYLVADNIQDNAVQLSASSDGSKVFFTWCDSDPAVSGGDNSTPNLLGRSLDVDTKLLTPTVNFTQGDPIWDGYVLFPRVSPVTLFKDSLYIVPTIFTDPYTGDENQPVNHYYINDIVFKESDYTDSLKFSQYSLGNPVAGFNGSTSICTEQEISFSDNSTNALEWEWFFEGGNPSYSNLKNPGVVYDSVGLFDILLVVSSGTEIDSLNEIDYITVTENFGLSIITNNASCTNSNDGTITVSAYNGSSPYNYSWSNGDSISKVTDLGAGEYQLTISDQSSCLRIEDIIINEPDSVSRSFSFNDLICYGVNSGYIVAVITDNVTSYKWSTGETSLQINYLYAGTYTLSITDTNSCVYTNAITVSQPSRLQEYLTPFEPTCFGDSDGAIYSNTTGGTKPYYYKWSNNKSSSYLTNIVSGDYSLTVTDANGCITTESITLAEPDNLTYIAGFTPASDGGYDGEAWVDVSGGTPPYSYLWSDPNLQNTSKATGLAAGTYIVQIDDAVGCEALGLVTVYLVSIEEQTHNKKIVVHPNPNNGEFVIEFEVQNNQDISIELTNITGKVIFYENLSNLSGSYKREFSLSDYAKGVYNLKVVSDDGVATRKVIYK